jgi:hypothetical protein|tara:strand:- start:29 stop:262 length:234 start_codon:yes stop_codon:yes gene_type:complete
MKKLQYEKDILEEFMNFLMEDDYILTRNILPKYVEKTLYRGDGERELINFNLTFKKVSLKELKQRINFFVMGLKNRD